MEQRDVAQDVAPLNLPKLEVRQHLVDHFTPADRVSSHQRFLVRIEFAGLQQDAIRNADLAISSVTNQK